MTDTGFDYNKDGKITQRELKLAEELSALKRTNQRFESQRMMSWVAIISVVVAMGLLFSPFITDARVLALDNVVSMFFLAQSGVIAAYFGSSAWMTKKTEGVGDNININNYD